MNFEINARSSKKQLSTTTVTMTTFELYNFPIVSVFIPSKSWNFPRYKLTLALLILEVIT